MLQAKDNLIYLAEEKYIIAESIGLGYEFKVRDIIEEYSNLLCIEDAIYAMIGELLDKGLIIVESKRIHDSDFLDVVKTYKVDLSDLDKREKFKAYIDNLNYARVQPNLDGKPRNLSFRLVEEFLSEVKTLPIEARESSLTSAYKYLGSAQSHENDQVSKKLYNEHQSDLSKAHVTKLYAEYLIAKDSSKWLSSITQLLKSAKLFRDRESFKYQNICELQACEILIDNFDVILQSSLTKNLDFDNSIKKLQALSEECFSIIFKFVCSQIFDKIQNLVTPIAEENRDIFSNISLVVDETSIETDAITESNDNTIPERSGYSLEDLKLLSDESSTKNYEVELSSSYNDSKQLSRNRSNKLDKPNYNDLSTTAYGIKSKKNNEQQDINISAKNKLNDLDTQTELSIPQKIEAKKIEHNFINQISISKKIQVKKEKTLCLSR